MHSQQKRGNVFFMEAKIQVGDVVQLKSGGPRMTVQHVGNEGSARCAWFGDYRGETEKISEAHFAVAALQRVQMSRDE